MKQLLKQSLVIEENMLAHRLLTSEIGKRLFVGLRFLSLPWSVQF